MKFNFSSCATAGFSPEEIVKVVLKYHGHVLPHQRIFCPFRGRYPPPYQPLGRTLVPTLGKEVYSYKLYSKWSKPDVVQVLPMGNCNLGTWQNLSGPVCMGSEIAAQLHFPNNAVLRTLRKVPKKSFHLHFAAPPCPKPETADSATQKRVIN